MRSMFTDGLNIHLNDSDKVTLEYGGALECEIENHSRPTLTLRVVQDFSPYDHMRERTQLEPGFALDATWSRPEPAREDLDSLTIYLSEVVYERLLTRRHVVTRCMFDRIDITFYGSRID
jgi:hypothetical protein